MGANIGSIIGGFTAKEAQAIYTYLKGLTKPYSSIKVLGTMKGYKPEMIQGTTVAQDSDGFFAMLKEQHGTMLEKQKINDFETLKHRAMDYCERYNIRLG